MSQGDVGVCNLVAYRNEVADALAKRARMALNLSVAGASRPNRRFEFVEDIDVDVCVHHLAKSNADKALYRGIGSINFAAACRSVLLADHDADDTQEGKDARIN